MRHLSLECRFEAYFLDFRMQIQRQNANAKANEYENGFYALNAAFISWMPLRSVIFRFQNANTKAKCKCKVKCIGKWFLCTKCGIYLLNAASKRDFSISEGKYKKFKCKGKYIGKWFLCPKCGIYLLNAAFKRDFSILKCKYKGKMQIERQMHRKMVLIPKCGIYLLNAALKRNLSISEGKYKGKCKG